MVKVYQNGVNVQFRRVGLWVIKRKIYVVFLLGKKNSSGWYYKEVFRIPGLSIN